MTDATVVRLAAVGDFHCTKTSQGGFQAFFAQVSDAADVLAVCGDFTDYGLPEEARVLARELTASVKVPVVGVLGNHDFESGKQDEVRQILEDAGVAVLDGDAVEIKGVGFAGVKGFAGGFGPRALGPWGEPIIKQFVHEAVSEALKLEAALGRLRTGRTIALLHYAPVVSTVEGEPVEIYAFLGCSRLEEPLLRYPVTAVFHGHAHRGQPTGRTRAHTPVYNVSMPLLSRTYPDRAPFLLLEVRVEGPAPPVPDARPNVPAIPIR
jgi:Icc-related predicted phosphoesterase